MVLVTAAVIAAGLHKHNKIIRQKSKTRVSRWGSSYPERAPLTELEHPEDAVLKLHCAVELGQVVIIDAQQLDDEMEAREQKVLNHFIYYTLLGKELFPFFSFMAKTKCPYCKWTQLMCLVSQLYDAWCFQSLLPFHFIFNDKFSAFEPFIILNF